MLIRTFEPGAGVAYLWPHGIERSARTPGRSEDLPEDPSETVDDEAEDELPDEIEMEPEEISSGVDVLAPDGTKKSAFPDRM